MSEPSYPIYAVGDIHGQLVQLEAALIAIAKDGGKDAAVVFIGDLVDRGPDSRRVIELLISLCAEGRNFTIIKGNHDRMFEWFMQIPTRHDPRLLVGMHWFHDRLGGRETMASYGVDVHDRRNLIDVHKDALEKVPQAHVDFLKSLNIKHVVNDKLFVHAGIRPGVALDQQTEADLLWIRQEFHAHQGPHAHLVIHGHTPIDTPTHYGNRINLDGGAGLGRPLVPVVIEGRQMRPLL
ncbi:MAG: metallophosphoesterase family protein [Paracoccaceae bacterium]